MALVLVMLIVGVTYRVGSHQLVKTFASKEEEDATAKGGCCKSPTIHDMNGAMIVLTSSRISLCW